MKRFSALVAAVLTMSQTAAFAGVPGPTCRLTYADLSSDQQAAFGSYIRFKAEPVSDEAECLARARKSLSEPYVCYSAFEKHPKPQSCVATHVDFDFRDGATEVKGKIAHGHLAADSGCEIAAKQRHLKTRFQIPIRDVAECQEQAVAVAKQENAKRAQFAGAAGGLEITGRLKRK